MSRFVNDRGFSHCSLTMASCANGQIRSTRLLTDLPEAYCSLYQSKLVGLDPFLLFSCHTYSASTVTTEDFSEFAGASPEHQAFLDLTAESGAKHGVGIPVRTFGGSPFGGWLFTSQEEDRAFNLLHTEYATEAHLAGILAYEKMIDVEDLADVHQSVLSDREKECLLWLCAGLRTVVIAEKLSISQSAVNLYVTNAKRKLGAKTREQAIAKAIISGEIVL